MSVNIPLFDGYRILSDKYQYILAREDGERMVHESFHVEIEDCVKEFISRKIRGFNATSIQSLLISIKTLQAGCDKVLQPLKLEVVSVGVSQ